MARHFAVTGLGYGDEGKGSIVDALAMRLNSPYVVRYNGGAQAAHHVVLEDGTTHRFSSWGSGTLRGAKTYLASRFILNAYSMFSEAKKLRSFIGKNPWEEIVASPLCPVTTYIHVYLNRLRELARGGNRHGSCGMGIGETYEMEDLGIGVLRASDIRDEFTINELLREQAEWAQEEVSKLTISKTDDYIDKVIDILHNKDLIPIEVDRILALGNVLDVLDDFDYDFLRELSNTENVIWEGAQGLLLDEEIGFFPHVTRSKTDITWIEEELSTIDLVSIGVTRTYMTRHGNGPFPSEGAPGFSKLTFKDHNKEGKWQGNFRVGALDIPALKYGLDNIKVPPDYLAITCVDALDSFGSLIPVCSAYKGEGLLLETDIPFYDSLDCRSDNTLELSHKSGIYIFTPKETYIEKISNSLGIELGITSSGPKASDKKFHNSFVEIVNGSVA